MVNGLPDVALAKVRIAHHVRHGIHGASEQTAGLCGSNSVSLVDGRKPGSIRPFDLVDERVGDHSGRIHQVRVIEQILAVDHAQETRQAIGGAHNVDVPILT